MQTARPLLYNFYIRSARKRQLTYAIIFGLMLLYAVINGIVLRRAETDVALEVFIVTVFMVSASPVLAEWFSKGVIREVIEMAVSHRPLLREARGARLLDTVLVLFSDMVAATAILVVTVAAFPAFIASYPGAVVQFRTHEYILMGLALFLAIDHFLLRRRMER